MMRGGLRCLFLLVALPFGASAQSELLYEAYSKKYPDKTSAAIELKRKINLDLVKGKPEITYIVEEELIYFGKQAVETSERSLFSTDLMELVSVEAFVLIPEKGKYKTNKVTNFKESTVGNKEVFYDDEKEVKFQLEGIVQGAKTIIRSEYKVKDPHFIPSMPLYPYMPVEKGVFEIDCARNLDLQFTERNFEGLSVKSTREEKGGKIKQIYEFKEVNAPEPENDGPDWRFFTPEVHVRIKEYKGKDQDVPVLRNVTDLHTWYCEFMDQSKEEIDSFKPLSDSIVAGCKTDREKAETLYRWVQKNVRYIAIEDGYMGYIPQKASLVCHNRYGDCKGMSNLLWYLMRAQGLPAYHTWVGTRKLPYTYEQMASPVVNNHMIVCYKENGKNLFLDPTHSRLAFDFPSPFIQEKEALVTDGCKSFEVVKIPSVPADRNRCVDTVWAKLNGNTLQGDAKVVLYGHSRMYVTERVNLNEYKPLCDFARSFLIKGNNKFILDTIWAENADDPNVPLTIHYRFHNPDYLFTSGSESFVNLNLSRNQFPDKIRKDRKIGMEYEQTIAHHITVILDLGKGVKVNHVPADAAFAQPGFGYSIKYNQSADKVSCSTVETIDVLALEPAQFGAWNDFVKFCNNQANNQTILSIPK